MWIVDDFFMSFGQFHNVKKYYFSMNVQFITVASLKTFIFGAKKHHVIMKSCSTILTRNGLDTMSSKQLIQLYFFEGSVNIYSYPDFKRLLFVPSSKG